MKCFLVLLISFTYIHLHALDKVDEKGKSANYEIIEIGAGVIKYKESEESSDLSIAIPESNLLKIIPESGRDNEFNDTLNANSSAEDRKKAIKMHFLSPAVGYLAFSYEQIIKPGRGIESTLGIIGIGSHISEHRSRGVHIGLGYKLMRTPDFYSSKSKYPHIMKGGYIKPQVICSAYINTYDDGPILEEKRDIFAVAFLANFGTQVISSNTFLMDFSVGLGCGFTNQGSKLNDLFYDNLKFDHYGFLILGSRIPVSLSFNFKVGLLLKQKGSN